MKSLLSNTHIYKYICKGIIYLLTYLICKYPFNIFLIQNGHERVVSIDDARVGHVLLAYLKKVLRRYMNSLNVVF